MYFRLPNPEDIPGLQHLFVDTERSVNTFDNSSNQIRAWTSSITNVARWRQLVTDHYCILAFDLTDHLIGIGSPNKDAVDFLYVHQDHQRKEVASKILDILMA